MSNESLLKKEFKHSDVQRVRNLVNKDYTAATKTQVGYQKTNIRHKEGEIWEENGKNWTMKNGIKQNLTKLDAAKKASRVPLTCPKCGGTMKHHLAKKMYKIHGFCFDPCTVEFETGLQKAGLYESYEKKLMSGNIQAFAKDIEEWVLDMVSGTNDSFVTEEGVVEDWNSNDNKNKQLLDDIKTYLGHLREHF